ncbi:bacteriohemerythrin [Desulfohalovibrio reitneri]|uniref:bacteriohemerythrin n=1 Tax=Desulfohalovibrio reitneri TaxID=1307759 RepID=UPI0004A72D64|nr:bacteriohemerythrin [Desulfohalovibrio reitneri]
MNGDKKRCAPSLAWNEKLSTGHTEIDEQHKGLIQLANDLLETVRAGKGAYLVDPILRRLRVYTRDHFRAEERIMASAGYPELARHAREHAQILGIVEQLNIFNDEGKPIDPDELLCLLREWLINHILGHDLPMASHLRSSRIKNRC